MMDLLSGRRHTIAPRDVLVVQQGGRQLMQVRIRDRRGEPAQFPPHLLGIARGGREVIGEIHLAVVQLVDGVQSQLRPVVEDLDQSLDLDEVVALEGLHDFGDVIPHFGVQLAGAVAELERQIRIALLLLPDLFGANQEAAGDDRDWHRAGDPVRGSGFYRWPCAWPCRSPRSTACGAAAGRWSPPPPAPSAHPSAGSVTWSTPWASRSTPWASCRRVRCLTRSATQHLL